MLGLTFSNESDYDLIQEGDKFSFVDLVDFKPNQPLTADLIHENGTKDTIKLKHTYNEAQIEWFKAGSALNYLKNNQ